MRRWEQMAAILKDRNPKAGVELGAKDGKFSEHLLGVFPDLRMTCVDLFASREKQEREGFETYEEWDFEQIRREYDKRIAPFRDRVTTLVMDTKDAAGAFDTGSVDFIFIDAEHTYEGVKADIAAWYDKVRPGGIIAGHDFSHKWPGVERAVGESFNLLTVVLGADHTWIVQR